MIRVATPDDLPVIAQMRAQVHALHAKGRPDIFRADLTPELAARAREFLERPDAAILLAERDGVVCGFACVNEVVRAQSPYNNARAFLHVEEFGVDESHRRQGVGRELFDFIRAYAREKGLHRVELDMWAFNADALRFYESIGLKTYRHDMECEV